MWLYVLNFVMYIFKIRVENLNLLRSLKQNIKSKLFQIRQSFPLSLLKPAPATEPSTALSSTLPLH